MGSKHDDFEQAIIEWIFNNDVSHWVATGLQIGSGTPVTPLASATDDSLYIALAWNDASLETMQLSLHECNGTTTGLYAGYARVAVARSTVGWTVGTVGDVANAAAIAFVATATTDSGTIGRFAICASGAEGTDDILYQGALASNIVLGSGVITPTFAQGALTVSEA